MKQTLEQERAKHVVENLEKEYSKDDVNELRGIPSMILTSGLGQVAAFYKAKSAQHPKAHLAFENFEGWLKQKQLIDKTSLILSITNGNALLLRRLTDEAMAYFQWYIRLAEGRIKKDQNNE